MSDITLLCIGLMDRLQLLNTAEQPYPNPRFVVAQMTEYCLVMCNIFSIIIEISFLQIQKCVSTYTKQKALYRVFHDLWTLLQEVIS